MKKMYVLGLLTLLSVGAFAQSEAQQEVVASFGGVESEPKSTPAQLFQREEVKRKRNTEIGFQANIDLDGNFTRCPGVIYTTSVGQTTTDPFTVGGISMGGGLGFRYRRFMYVGAAFNFTGNWGSTGIYDRTSIYWVQTGSVKVESWVVPIFADIRFLLPTDSRCYPFLDFGIGGFVCLSGQITTQYSGTTSTAIAQMNNGFYFQAGIGAELKYLTVALGYKLYDNPNIYNHSGYIKLGVSLGRPAKIK